MPGLKRAFWAVLVGLIARGAVAETIELNGHRFALPEGFEIELAAGPELVKRPITAAFDELGRLYVSESSGTNDPVGKQLEEKPHRILRLEDRDGDGKFDRSTVFADRMMFPEGTMWRGGSLYVAAPPQIWKLTDTDDDGMADLREVWHDGRTLTGCANDLHGPYPGPDGWIYWTKGAFAEQTFTGPRGEPVVTKASHIFRAREDGSGMEAVMTGGMDNPVDVAFTAGGERIFTTTFLVHPGGGQRDGLIHAIYGGLYGKVHEPIFDHVWTGPHVMPVLTHLGPAAPSGLLRYEEGNFGPEYEGDLFACLFNLHKVTRHKLAAEGSGLRAEDSDFVVAESLDFHPTDVIEDADGSLLVLDTGGWYKLCCPTSQLHKPEVLGAIYRVRKKGGARVDDPRGLKLVWGKASAEDQAGRLGDLRWAVRERAVDALGRLGSVDELGSVARKHPDSMARVGAVWALTRIPGEAAREGIREALRDRDATVRQAALSSISLWKDAGAAGELARILSSGGMAEKRLAAEAIGRIGRSQAVGALLEAASTGEMDREFEHAVAFALILIGDRGETTKGLGAKSARARRIALVAIDQMPGAALEFEEVSRALYSRDEPESEAALWVASRHPEWARELAPLVREWLMEATTASKEKASRFLGSDEARKVLGEVARVAQAGPRRAAFELMGRGDVVAEPAGWGEAVRAGIASEDREIVRAALGVVGKVMWSAEEVARIEAAIGLLVARGERSIVALGLGAMPRPGFALREDEFRALVASLGTDEAVAVRGQAAQALTRAGLTDSQWVDLAAAVGGLGPMELATLLPVFERSSEPAVGEALVAGLEGSKALVGLGVEDLKKLLARFGPRVQEGAKVLIAGMEQEREGRHARLESLLSKVPRGDIVRGQAVFNGPRAACSSCHAMGYLGGKVGPDLTKVGSIRSDRDLLEAIVYPSASFVRSYEPMLVATTDGRVLNGLLKKDGAEEVVLAIDATQEVRIARSEIEEMKAGEVSVMPAGLDQQLTEEQIADLVAFLKAAK